MGQQPSKKSKKNGKDRDTTTDGSAEGSVEDPSDVTQVSTSKSTSETGSTSGGEIAQGNGIPSISVTIPESKSPARQGAKPPHSPVPGSSTSTHAPAKDPYPSVPSSVSPSSSPNLNTSSKLAPLDIPSAQQTILNGQGTPFTPGSAAFTPGSAAGDAAANAKAIRQLDIDDMIQRLLDVGYTGKVSKSLCLKNTEIAAICMAARDIFLNQPTLIELSPPVKIVGDVHGQYSDLIRLFEMCGFPPAANYLFLGDYVDRGKQSLETILLLLCYKIKYPENFFLLRGNHECANVTRGACNVEHSTFPRLIERGSVRLLRRVQTAM